MSIFLPDYREENIFALTEEKLKKWNIKALILDIDNTLTVDKCPTPAVGVKEWVEKISTAGIALIILSNRKNSGVEAFSKKIGVPAVSSALKPLPFGVNRAIKRLHIKKENVAIVGDQIFTDVLAGRMGKIKTILVTPFCEEQNSFFKLKRYMEKIILKNHTQGQKE